jgi:hypothetical protein
MTFQQLLELFANEDETLKTILKSEDKWQKYLDWYNLGPALWRDSQKFLSVIPDELVIATLSQSRLRFKCRIISLGEQPPSSESISALEAYKKYGALAVATAFERGAFDVPVMSQDS